MTTEFRVKKVKEFMSKGQTLTEGCKKVGISPATYYYHTSKKTPKAAPMEFKAGMETISLIGRLWLSNLTTQDKAKLMDFLTK